MRRKRQHKQQVDQQAWAAWLSNDLDSHRDKKEGPDGGLAYLSMSPKRLSTSLDGFTPLKNRQSTPGIPVVPVTKRSPDKSNKLNLTQLHPRPMRAIAPRPSAPPVKVAAKSKPTHAAQSRGILSSSAVFSAPIAPPEAPIAEGRDISVHISLPKLSISFKRIWNVVATWLPKLKIWAAVAAVIAVLGVGYLLLGSKPKNRLGQGTPTESSIPTFAPLAPAAPSPTVSQTTKFDAARQLYEFHDQYQGANITVNEQALPSSLSENPSKLADVAKKNLYTSTSFTTASGIVYIATDQAKGVQRMVFIHGQVLIFIQSTKVLDTVSWVTYIQSLQ